MSQYAIAPSSTIHCPKPFVTCEKTFPIAGPISERMAMMQMGTMQQITTSATIIATITLLDPLELDAWADMMISSQSEKQKEGALRHPLPCDSVLVYPAADATRFFQSCPNMYAVTCCPQKVVNRTPMTQSMMPNWATKLATRAISNAMT